MKREKRQEPLELKVLRFLKEHQLVSSRYPLLVAVSGGPDSVCLLHILVTLQEELGIKLHVAHLNHKLRGAEAEADACYATDIAHRLAIPATIEARDVRGYQARHRLSLEEAAREVRYTFLAEVAMSIGTTQVAVGHTLDDNVETILMHLMRGAGTRGLRGLLPSVARQFPGHNLTVIRPLLPVTRKETASYCHHHQLGPCIDASNLSLAPLRNRVRLKLLPLLQSYNPRIVEALLRTARIASEDIAFLEEEVSRVWNEIVQEQEDTIYLNKERFLELHPALKRHLLRASTERLLGNLKDIEALHIEDMMSALTKPAGKRLNLPAGLVFSIGYDRYLLGRGIAAPSPFPVLEGEIPLKIPGETRLPGWHVTAAIIGREQVAEVPDNFTACFDLGKTGGDLVVRPRRRGERFQPLGMGQSKKLGEFMIDAKVSRAWRSRIPIVSSPSQILWVVGWRIDERVKVTDATRKILYLKMERQ